MWFKYIVHINFKCTIPVSSCKYSKYIAIGTSHFSRIPTVTIWKVWKYPINRIRPFVWLSIDLGPNLFMLGVEMIKNILETDSLSPMTSSSTAPGWNMTTIYSVELATIRVWAKDFSKNTFSMVNFKVVHIHFDFTATPFVILTHPR